MLICIPIQAQIKKGGGGWDTPAEKFPDIFLFKKKSHNLLTRVIALETKVNKLRADFNKRYKKCYKVKKDFKNLSEIVIHLNLLDETSNPICKSLETDKRIVSEQYSCLVKKGIRKQLIEIEQTKALDHYLVGHEDVPERSLESFHKDLKLHGTDP